MKKILSAFLLLTLLLCSSIHVAANDNGEIQELRINNITVEVLHFVYGLYRLTITDDDFTDGGFDRVLFSWQSPEGTFSEESRDGRSVVFQADLGTGYRTVRVTVQARDSLGHHTHAVAIYLKGNDDDLLEKSGLLVNTNIPNVIGNISRIPTEGIERRYSRIIRSYEAMSESFKETYWNQLGLDENFFDENFLVVLRWFSTTDLAEPNSITIRDEQGTVYINTSPSIPRTGWDDAVVAETIVIEMSKTRSHSNRAFRLGQRWGGAFIIPPPLPRSPDEIRVRLNGIPMYFDAAPIVGTDSNRSTLVPFREMFETLGFEVSWDDETRTAIATKDSYKIEVPISTFSRAVVNGEDVTFHSTVILYNDRTFIPLRLIRLATGATIAEWGNSTTQAVTRTVWISTN